MVSQKVLRLRDGEEGHTFGRSVRDLEQVVKRSFLWHCVFISLNEATSLICKN
jgi:hypothetical protein